MVDLREIEDVVDEREQVPRAASDTSQVDPLFLRDGSADAHLNQFGVASDGIERRAQVMTHVRQEPTLRAVRYFCRLHRRVGLRSRHLRRDQQLPP